MQDARCRYTTVTSLSLHCVRIQSPRMRSLLACLAFILAFIGGGLLVQAAKSFAGANLYYAAGLSSSDAETLLS